VNGVTPEGAAIDGSATIHDLARQLVNDTREALPVADQSGNVVGVLQRKDALDLLLGAG
jgi:glycine betaine/proline transport system ATP-binding protein